MLRFLDCGDAIEAARQLGYRKPTISGPRLLARPSIAAEIERRRQSGQAVRRHPVSVPAIADGATVEQVEGDWRQPRKRGRPRKDGSSSPPPPPPIDPTDYVALEGEVLPPEPIDTSQFGRPWIRERLMRNAMIALGEMPTRTAEILKIRRPDGSVQVKSILVEAIERDGAVANKALELLAQEALRLEALGLLPRDDPGYLQAVNADRAAVQHQPAAENVRDLLADRVRQMRRQIDDADDGET